MIFVYSPSVGLQVIFAPCSKRSHRAAWDRCPIMFSTIMKIQFCKLSACYCYAVQHRRNAGARRSARKDGKSQPSTCELPSSGRCGRRQAEDWFIHHETNCRRRGDSFRLRRSVQESDDHVPLAAQVNCFSKWPSGWQSWSLPSLSYTNTFMYLCVNVFMYIYDDIITVIITTVTAKLID